MLNRSQGWTKSGSKETVRLQNRDDSVEGDIHESAAVEAMTGQRVFSPALRAVVRTVAIRIGDLVEVTLDGAGEWM
jgi:hypothetical protein